MRNNALRAEGYTRQDYIQDNFKPGEEPWEVRRARIARAAEDASNLPGNDSGGDFGEFILRNRFIGFA